MLNTKPVMYLFFNPVIMETFNRQIKLEFIVAVSLFHLEIITQGCKKGFLFLSHRRCREAFYLNESQ